MATKTYRLKLLEAENKALEAQLVYMQAKHKVNDIILTELIEKIKRKASKIK